MTSITIEEVQTNLPEIVRRLQPGEEITITDYEQPLAQVKRVLRASWPCKAGSAKYSILRIAADFDASIDDFRDCLEGSSCWTPTRCCGSCEPPRCSVFGSRP